MAWTDEHLTMLSDCEQRESRLADWERGFVDGLRNWIKRDNCPSAKQLATLDDIWERVTKEG